MLYYILLLVLNKKDDLRKRFEKRIKKVVDFLLNVSYDNEVAENNSNNMNLEN